MVNTANFNPAQLLPVATRRLMEAGCDTPNLDAEVLLAHTLQKDRTWLYTHSNDPLDDQQLTQFESLLQRRIEREPVAYLVGHKEFFGLDFLVSPATLIPRPETELLIETALAFAVDWSAGPPLSLVDVGTGSGCIAITLAKQLPMACIVAVDLSAQALTVARQNADRHQVSEQITFVQGNLLELLDAPVDLIVSNPPYVNRADLAPAHTTPEVHHYEPQLALDGGPDGLAVISKLISQAGQWLKPEGALLVEIGADQGRAVLERAGAQFGPEHCKIKPDLAGLDRLLMVKR